MVDLVEMGEIHQKIRDTWLAGRPDPNDMEIRANMAPGSNPMRLKISQAVMDAARKIRVGTKGGDEQLVEIGQAELRVLNLKPTPDDLELLRIEM